MLAGKSFGPHTFVRAAVDRPILGADFFESTGLAIDVKRRRLFSAADPSFSAPLHVAAAPPRSLGLVERGVCQPTASSSQLGVSVPPPRTAMMTLA